MVVDMDEKEVRIDSYLSFQLGLSRSKIQKLIKDGLVFVNGKKISSSYKVHGGDQIEVQEMLDDSTILVAEDLPIDVIYEDDDLLVINKESGMVVHPAPGHYSGTLVNALLYHFDIEGGEKDRPGIVHRLDKDTSGLMLVAKNEWTLEKLSKMIHDKEVERHYLAIVCGEILHDTGTIEAPIGRDMNDRQKMAVTDIHGKDSITHFKVLERFSKHTFIECILETGRTHQIRVHLAYIGHPVLNDPLYNKKKATDFGQMLHSKSISFLHPRTGERLFFEVDPPKEFLDTLAELREEKLS